MTRFKFLLALLVITCAFNGALHPAKAEVAEVKMVIQYSFAFLHLNRPRDLPRRFGLSWGITPERGEMRGLSNTDRLLLQGFPGLTKRFPNTEKAYTGTVPHEQFKPGESYVFWWAHTQETVPDLAVAITIDSDRGREEFGSIVWR